MAKMSRRPWQRLQAHVYATETHCHICGGYVDQTLPPNDRMARSVDHVIPMDRGGPAYQRSNLRLAHRRCNSAKADAPPPPPALPARSWL